LRALFLPLFENFKNLEHIFISEEKYLKKMLKKLKMEDYKHVTTPMIVGCKLCKNDESPEVDQI